MFDSDADRLEMIQSLGGQLVRPENFWAIYDNEFLIVEGMETSQPILTCRTSDVRAASLAKDDILLVLDESGEERERKVRRIEPDGTGMTKVVLFQV